VKTYTVKLRERKLIDGVKTECWCVTNAYTHDIVWPDASECATQGQAREKMRELNNE